jgi:pyruvate dehydrogenase E2 component (dihydrolipoamide acetyltransferase)
MLVEVQMPHMGQSMEEGKIIEWLVKAGDRVKKGDPMAEIETDKAVISLEAPTNGTVEKINTKSDQVVPVGTVLVLIEDGKPGTSEKPKQGKSTIEEKKSEVRPPVLVEKVQTAISASDRRVKASPVAKRLAGELGLDLSQITASGPDGMISKEDVQDFYHNLSAKEKSIGEPTAAVPLSKMKKVTAERMMGSKAQIPHFYVSMEIKMDKAMELRESMKKQGKEISVNDLVIKGTVIALKDFPNLNATYLEDRLILHQNIDMAVAVSVDEGLITPVLKNCEHLSLTELSEQTRALIDRARSGSLKSNDLEAGTFTVSNLGMFDVKEFSAIINPPQVAILAVGKVQNVPYFDEDDNIISARMMNVTISADHRATDGVEAAKFLQRIKAVLEDGYALLIN